MKLLRYGAIGAEKPGAIDRKGNLRDLSGHLAAVCRGIEKRRQGRLGAATHALHQPRRYDGDTRISVARHLRIAALAAHQGLLEHEIAFGSMCGIGYADEVRAFSEVPIEKAEVKEAELKLAKQLIEQAATDTFDASSYRDEVREQVMALIQRKVEGEDISVAPTEKPEHKIIDIMEALKASLEGSDKRKPAKATEEKTAAATKSVSKKKTARKKRAG